MAPAGSMIPFPDIMNADRPGDLNKKSVFSLFPAQLLLIYMPQCAIKNKNHH
jgi:hypothetical protein